MRDHFGAVEADFQSHYGLDLRQVLWGSSPYGVRRIHALVAGLPPTGAMIRAAATNGQPWSVTDDLLATVIEMIDHGNRMFFSANAKKGANVWKPITITRPVNQPSETHEPKKPSSVQEIRKFFGADAIEWSDN